MKCCLLWFALAACLSLPTLAKAEVFGWQIIKAQGFEQTANDTQPTSASTAVAFADVFADPGDFVAVTLNGTSPGPIAFSGPSFERWRIDEDQSDLNALNTAFPNTTYTINATPAGGGSLVSESVTLAGDFPAATPFFNGPVYEALQGFNASQDVTLTWDTLPLGVEAFVFIDDDALGFEVFGEEVTGLTNLVVPGDTLDADTEYIALFAFFVTSPDQPDGFSTGAGRSGYVNFTELFFTTTAIPEPTTGLLSLLAVGIASGSRRRHRTR